MRNFIGTIIDTIKIWVSSNFATKEALRNVESRVSQIATDEEILEMLKEEDVLPVVVDLDGSVLSDENGNVLLW